MNRGYQMSTFKEGDRVRVRGTGALGKVVWVTQATGVNGTSEEAVAVKLMNPPSDLVTTYGLDELKAAS